MSLKIKVLIFTGFYLPGFKGGGPIKTIKNLIEYTGDLIDYRVITSDRDLGDTYPYSNISHNNWVDLNKSKVMYISKGFDGLIQIVNLMAKLDYDLIYLNSFFSSKFTILPLLISKIIGKKVILAPRGEFSKGALLLKTNKKKIYIRLFKLFKLEKNITFQASTLHEKYDIQSTLGANIDIYIAENIGSQDFANSIPQKKHEQLRGVFISRISPKKNLLFALEVISGLKVSISYDIYGPIEDMEYWKECMVKILDMPTHIKVSYKGELHPNDIIETLTPYDFFFMPTKGENYGHVITEALCAGLPLIISNSTPWKDLYSKDLGWDLPLNNIESFRDAISELSSLSSLDLKNKRQAILDWATNRFSYNQAVQDNINMFRYAYNKNKEKNHV